MEAKRPADSQKRRIFAQFHLLLACEDQAGIHIVNLDEIQLVSVDKAIEVIRRQGSQLLRNLVQANIPLLLVGQGALERLASEINSPDQGWPAPVSAGRRLRQSDQENSVQYSTQRESAKHRPPDKTAQNHGFQPTARRPGMRTSKRIKRAIDFMREHSDEQISLNDVSREACLSACYFCRLFKKELGITYSNYLTSIRVADATRLLLGTDLSVTEICYRIGFNDLTHFERVFRRRTRMTPTRFRAQFT